MGGLTSLLGVALLSVAGFQTPGSRAEDSLPPSIVSLVPRETVALDQLAYARRLKRLSYECAPDLRSALRLRAVEAYRVVRSHFPDDPKSGAEAAFRAGELLRADGAQQLALEEFQLVRRLDPGSVFRARAGLECGHIHRRAGRSPAALRCYLEVANDHRSSARYRDEARLWIGRMHRNEGRFAQARTLWLLVAKGALHPRDRIHAYDELALLWLDRGDVAAARAELRQCDAAFAALVLEQTWLGETIRQKLRRMRARTRLDDELEAKEN